MNKNINKNISVWRGDSTPPTDYHLWIKSDGTSFIKVDDQYKLYYNPNVGDVINVTALTNNKHILESDIFRWVSEEGRSDYHLNLHYGVRILFREWFTGKWNEYIYIGLDENYSESSNWKLYNQEDKFSTIELNIQLTKNIVTRLEKLTINKIKPSNNQTLASYILTDGSFIHGYTIDIPKDKSLKDIKLGYENASVDLETGEINIGTPSEIETDALYMIYSVAVADGTFTMVKVNLSKFISEKEYSDGLKVEGSKLKVKKDPSSETYLSVSSNGVKISGIDSNFGLVNSKLADINKVLYNQHSKVTLSGNPSIIEKGLNALITMSWKYIYDDKEATPTSMQLKSGGTILELVNKEYTDTISDSKSYYVVAVNQGITKLSGTFTVNAYYPMYFGEGGEVFDRTSIITASNKRPIASSPRGDVSITFTGGQYLWLCVPNTMSVNKVTSSGFAVPMEAPVNQTVNETYKCYRSTDTINKGTIKFTIS